MTWNLDESTMIGTREISGSRRQVAELGHRLLGIEQALVHVDVDDLRAIGDLVARHIERGCVIALRDQLPELAEPVTLVRSPTLTKGMSRRA